MTSAVSLSTFKLGAWDDTWSILLICVDNVAHLSQASGRSHVLYVLADCCVMLKCSNHRLTSVYCTITASVLVGGLCTCVFAGNTQASCKGLSVLETCFARLSVSSELLSRK